MSSVFRPPTRVATNKSHDYSRCVPAYKSTRKAYVVDWDARARIARDHLAFKSDEGLTGTYGAHNEITVRKSNQGTGNKVKTAMTLAGLSGVLSLALL